MATAFENLAARVVRDLMAALHITKEQAAGIAGNIQGESRFEAVQEKNPTSGRGGFGWCQWTGPRRVAFENWCKAKGLGLTSYEANLGFLVQELQTSEANTLKHLRMCSTAKAAAETFEHFFERSRDGQRNWPVRVRYAQQALSLYRAQGGQPMPTTVPAPANAPDPKPWYLSKTIIGGVLTVFLGLLGLFFPPAKLVDPNTAADFVLHLIEVGGPVVTGLMVIIGRLRADQPIAGTKAAQVVDARYEEALNTPAPYQTETRAEPAAQATPFMGIPGLPDLNEVFGGNDPAAAPGTIPTTPQTYVGFGQLVSAIGQFMPYLLSAYRLVQAHPELKQVLVSLFEMFREMQAKSIAPAPDKPYSGM